MSKHQRAQDAAASQIDWDGGQRLTLGAGDTATCTDLNPGQLYAIFLYNSALHDTNTTVYVVGSNAQQPIPVTVPGTTANQGLASLVLVKGSDTQTISVSIPSVSANSGIDCWLGSVQMPLNTAGLNNSQLPANGQPQPFGKYARYFAVVPSSWHQLSINSAIQQFISVQFSEAFATVNIVNPIVGASANVTAFGTVLEGTDYKVQKAPASSPQTLSYEFEGNGLQSVWMNADSPQDSTGATIALQFMGAR